MQVTDQAKVDVCKYPHEADTVSQASQEGSSSNSICPPPHPPVSDLLIRSETRRQDT